jgi:hypothetical protein
MFVPIPSLPLVLSQKRLLFEFNPPLDVPKAICHRVKPVRLFPVNWARPTSPVEFTQSIHEYKEDDGLTLVRRVKRRPEVFAVVLSISNLEFGEVVHIPILPFAQIKRAVVSQGVILLVLKTIVHPVQFCQI